MTHDTPVRRDASATAPPTGSGTRSLSLVPATSRNGYVRSEPSTRRLRSFVSLTKPGVVRLIVFTAVIGMFLAPGPIRLAQAVFGAIGIGLVAAAAAATNCLLEAK